MAGKLNCIIQGDCVEQLGRIEARTVDLAFADPPFNIGYDYDEYDDRKSADVYLRWSREWIRGVIRALKPDGAFWLAIGDEYAAELKVMATRELGLTCRSWVVWYYTFGVHCKLKFTRSHAHMFHFVKDPKRFTFNADEIRVPSARQLVYGDRRANAKGRVPDDTWIVAPTPAALGERETQRASASPRANGRTNGATSPLIRGGTEGGSAADAHYVPSSMWILRPQDIPTSFAADSDTWYFPRVCGTFKERKGFHGCQMPEQLLGRIIRACSNEGETVLDPFAGSGTTLAVAKKLRRAYVGFELSKQYANESQSRLRRIKPGDPLDGAENPLATAPTTANGIVRNEDGTRVKKNGVSHSSKSVGKVEDSNRNHSADVIKPARAMSTSEDRVVKAFAETHEGYATDRVIADRELNAAYVERCVKLGLPGSATDWNLALLRMRKTSGLAHLKPMKRTVISRDELDQCEFGSEIGMVIMRDKYHVSLDRLFAEPELAEEFDETAARFAPGWSQLHYRWAALRLRKRRKVVVEKAKSLAQSVPELDLGPRQSVRRLNPASVPDTWGVYVLSGPKRRCLYVGATQDLRRRMEGHLQSVRAGNSEGTYPKELLVQFPEETKPLKRWFQRTDRLSRLRCLQVSQISVSEPRWNLCEAADWMA